MAINIVFAGNEKKIIESNDSFDVFSKNLDTLIEHLTEKGYSGDFSIGIRKYNSSCSLDFNWMLVGFPSGDFYEVEFRSFKINNAKKV